MPITFYDFYPNNAPHKTGKDYYSRNSLHGRGLNIKKSSRVVARVLCLGSGGVTNHVPNIEVDGEVGGTSQRVLRKTRQDPLMTRILTAFVFDTMARCDRRGRLLVIGMVASPCETCSPKNTTQFMLLTTWRN